MIHVSGHSAGSVAQKQFEVEHLVIATVSNGTRVMIYNDKVEILRPAGMRNGLEADEPIAMFRLTT